MRMWLLWLVLLASFGSAATHIFNGTQYIEDTYVFEILPSNNYGTANQLFVGYFNSSGVLYQANTYMAFNTTGIGSTAVVNNASFHLYFWGNDATMGVLNSADIYNMSCSAFDQSTITWNNKATQCTQASLQNQTNFSSIGWYAFNINNSFVPALRQIYSLVPNSSSGFNYYRTTDYGSYALGNISQIPYLRVDYSDTTPPTVISVVPTESYDRTPQLNLTLDRFGNCYACKFNISYSDMASNSSCVDCSDYTNLTSQCQINWTLNIGENDVYYACQNEDNVNDSQTETDLYQFIMQNQPINITSVQIGNDSQIGTAKECNYTWTDSYNDTISDAEFQWYNSSALTSLNTFIIAGSNFKDGENWTCSVRLNDTYNWSSWQNSSVMTIGDNITPVMHSIAADTQSKTINEIGSLYVNCTDANTIAWVKCHLYTWDDGGATYDANITTLAPASGLYTLSKSLNSIGTWGWRECYCMDGSGNLASNMSVGINITVSAAPSGGGGGGASTSAKKACMIKLSKDKLIVSGSGKLDSLFVTNMESESYIPSISATDTLKDIVRFTISPAVIRQDESGELGVLLTGANITAAGSLILTDSNCEDLIIPVTVDSGMFGFEIADYLMKQLFDFGAFQVYNWQLYLVLLAFTYLGIDAYSRKLPTGTKWFLSLFLAGVFLAGLNMVVSSGWI